MKMFFQSLYRSKWASRMSVDAEALKYFRSRGGDPKYGFQGLLQTLSQHYSSHIFLPGPSDGRISFIESRKVIIHKH
jgi:hypothetical protein